MAEEINGIMDMVCRFAGADPEANDPVLMMCYRAAVAWYEAAGVPENTGDELYDFWVCNLAAWMYDNRGNAEAGAAVPAYIVTSVHQLRKGVTRGLSDRPLDSFGGKPGKGHKRHCRGKPPDGEETDGGEDDGSGTGGEG